MAALEEISGQLMLVYVILCKFRNVYCIIVIYEVKEGAILIFKINLIQIFL